MPWLLYFSLTEYLYHLNPRNGDCTVTKTASLGHYLKCSVSPQPTSTPFVTVMEFQKSLLLTQVPTHSFLIFSHFFLTFSMSLEIPGCNEQISPPSFTSSAEMRPAFPELWLLRGVRLLCSPLRGSSHSQAVCFTL